jgi:glutamate N-acetyltransferase/amino-acid N-acetyltransferase
MSNAVSLPLGFRYACTYAGIRKVEKDDLALIVSDRPASAAAVFTKNRVVAGPVTVAKRNLRVSGGRMQAILVNAGNANCATATSEQVAFDSIRAAGEALGIAPHCVLPASTGVIGVELDVRRITAALPRLKSSLNPDSFDAAAAAILTTDTRSKTAFAQLRSGKATIAGMAKGSGMIHPRMATTLAFVVTDAVIPPAALRTALKQGIERSFNRISVDGDTSTNDTVAVLANGASKIAPAAKAFAEALAEVLASLAQQIVKDGEGARKFVTIEVRGAASDSAAEKIARSIANSPLVKTAIAGSDPNWGRIISAAGNAGVAFDPRHADIDMQGVPVCRGGLAADFSEDELKKKLDDAECSIQFTLRGKGRGQTRFWTCDLTEEYIRINASYRT